VGDADHLSDAQLGEYTRRANEGGGFSVRAYGPGAGREAADAYMVGGQVPSADYPGGASVGDARQFVTRHEGALRSEGRFFGGWGSPSDQRTSFDVSVAYPRTPGGESRARLRSQRTNQEAYGEVDAAGGYVGDRANPYYGQAPSPASRSWATAPIRTRRPGTPKRRSG
jgi:hypothetical protein